MPLNALELFFVPEAEWTSFEQDNRFNVGYEALAMDLKKDDWYTQFRWRWVTMGYGGTHRREAQSWDKPSATDPGPNSPIIRASEEWLTRERPQILADFISVDVESEPVVPIKQNGRVYGVSHDMDGIHVSTIDGATRWFSTSWIADHIPPNASYDPSVSTYASPMDDNFWGGTIWNDGDWLVSSGK